MKLIMVVGEAVTPLAEGQPRTLRIARDAVKAAMLSQMYIVEVVEGDDTTISKRPGTSVETTQVSLRITE